MGGEERIGEVGSRGGRREEGEGEGRQMEQSSRLTCEVGAAWL